MKFTKMHGLGNDYIYVNGFEEEVTDPVNASIYVSDRHFGIGGDGLVLILPSTIADFRMRMFNADGSEGEMCGNAIRCVAKYVYDRKMTDKLEITVETLAGIKRLQLNTKNGLVNTVRVWMGKPGFVDQSTYTDMLADTFPVTVSALDRSYDLYLVSMGNPHAVTFVEDVDNYPLPIYGPAIQQLPIFPKQINVEFIRKIDDTNLQMRVWERGSGETLACGTGACAAAAASMRLGIVEKKCSVHLIGGILDIEWMDDGIYMTGPATIVFDGEVQIP